jgi:hypothetical protein
MYLQPVSPIPTAPKDGTYLSVLSADGWQHQVYWCDEAAQWAQRGRAFSASEVAAFRFWRLSETSVRSEPDARVRYVNADDLAEQIADALFPRVSDRLPRDRLAVLLKTFAAEIKRSAIEP